MSVVLVLPARVQAQGSGGWQARSWDVDVTIPPDAYRATKPIELNGGFKVEVQPGTMLEGVEFQGKAEAQRWKIAGSQLRKVRIAGQLGIRVEATDSVFEECDLTKDSGWFVPWWGTRWTFENCIFTRQFMRGDLPVSDYSVNAARCTFYNLKLPSIGVRENAAGYMQQKDLVFQNCRFVQCEVPETLLAATVDCVFEGCQFSSKRFAWPKETAPIKVRAFFAGMGSAPTSFLNGPLSVQFAPAAKDVVVGSTLPHTQTGGRVTLANLRLPGQFAALGSVLKKASEIPNVAAPAPAAGRPALAPAASPVAGLPAAPELHSFDELLRPMPVGISLVAAGQLHLAGVESANAWLAATYPGRPVAIRVFLEAVQATSEAGYAHQVVSREQPVTFRGNSVPARIQALFRPETAGPLARLQKGADMVVRGVVKKAEFVGRGRSVELVVTLAEARTP